MSQESKYRTSIPVYINSFNQPTYVSRIVKSFLSNGFGNIIVIDQASTGPLTIETLKTIEMDSRCKIIRMKKNKGPRYFFDSLQYVLSGRYFIYTDPDIELPDIMPDNFMCRLIELSHQYRIGKVGCALNISDSDLFNSTTVVQEHETVPLSIVDFESRYWKERVESDVYLAAIDTTLALYNTKYFRLWNFFNALRVAGSFTIRHRPWYKDQMIPEAEFTYYQKQCLYSSWLNKDQSGNSLFKETPAIFLINKAKYLSYLMKKRFLRS